MRRLSYRGNRRCLSGPHWSTVPWTRHTFVRVGNTISKSYGGGIMLFGHDTTSQNISISENVFDRAGCIQNRADSGGIAVMCPNKQIPSVEIHSNTFLLCDDETPAINSPSTWGSSAKRDNFTQLNFLLSITSLKLLEHRYIPRVYLQITPCRHTQSIRWYKCRNSR